jgi:hypothetical protein
MGSPKYKNAMFVSQRWMVISARNGPFAALVDDVPAIFGAKPCHVAAKAVSSMQLAD